MLMFEWILVLLLAAVILTNHPFRCGNTTPCVTILTRMGNHLIAQATPQQEGCLCRIVWRKRVSFSVPAVTGPWTHESAHSLRIVSWTFDMFVRRAAWKRSAPLPMKCRSGGNHDCDC
jgi:hypothetical protein